MMQENVKLTLAVPDAALPVLEGLSQAAGYSDPENPTFVRAVSPTGAAPATHHLATTSCTEAWRDIILGIKADPTDATAQAALDAQGLSGAISGAALKAALDACAVAHDIDPPPGQAHRLLADLGLQFVEEADG